MKHKNIHKQLRQSERADIQESIDIANQVENDLHEKDFHKDMDFLDKEMDKRIPWYTLWEDNEDVNIDGKYAIGDGEDIYMY